MRRIDREITQFEQKIAVMKKCDVCRIAFFDEEYPYIVPFNFGMQIKGEEIVLFFHGAIEGKKYDLMKKNKKVGFEMDCGHKLVYEKETQNCTMEYESIVGRGILSFVPPEEKYTALCCIMDHYYKDQNIPFNQNIISKTNVFRLKVVSFTGKQLKK